MKESWVMKKLGDVCFIKSSNVSQNQLSNEIGDYPIFGASGLIKNVSFYHRDKPYLSIVKDGSGYGRITKMNAFTSVIGTLQYILPNEDVDLDYLYYSLMSVDFKKYVQGAAIPHIYFKDYKSEPFLWMPLSEQRKIVAILDEAFNAIASAKANAVQNLKNVKELFESYLQSVYENIEEDWTENKLGEVCIFKGGGTPSTKIKKYWEGDIPWVSPKDMKSKFISDSQDHLTSEAIKNSSTSLIQKESILIVVRSGILSRIVPLGITTRELSINQDLKALKPSKQIDIYFLYYFLECSMKLLLSYVSRGATVHRLSTQTLKELNIRFPNIKKQKCIVQKLNTLLFETKRLESIYQMKINDLEELKKSLLQKAFNGELNKK